MQGAEQPEADQERNKVNKVIENESRRNEVTKVKEEGKRMVNSLKNENGNLDLAIWVLVIEGTAISATWESRNQISKGSINRNN